MRQLLTLPLTVALTITPVATAHAQLDYGARGGLNFATIGGDVDLETRTGFTAGVFGRYPLGEFWQIGAELYFSQKGAKDLILRAEPDTTIGVDWKTRITYLELQLPLTLLPRIEQQRLQPRVYGGPTFAVELDCTTVFEGDPALTETYDCSQRVEFGIGQPEPVFTRTTTFELGVLLGAGVDIGEGPGAFTIDVRYVAGLTDINDVVAVETDLKNRTWQILVGYTRRPGRR